MTTKIGSCCGCFGRKIEAETEKPKRIQRSQNFRISSPRDINQVISTQIDAKAKEEAENAAQVYKETEK